MSWKININCWSLFYNFTQLLDIISLSSASEVFINLRLLFIPSVPIFRSFAIVSWIILFALP